MRLFFKAANIDTLKWLHETEKFGVGAVRPPEPYLHDTGKIEKVPKVDVRGEKILDEKGAEIIVDAKVYEQRLRISFDFHKDEENLDGVRKLAKQAGLEEIGSDEEVGVRWTEKKVEPPSVDVKDGEAVIVE